MNRTDQTYVISIVVLGFVTALISVWPLWLFGASTGTAETAPAVTAAEHTPTNEEDEDEYEDELVGELSFAGSTTVQPLVEALGEEYRQRHPDVALNIAAGGSVVGINAVQNGEVDIGMASRRLREGEQTEGMEVHQIAVDVLAVIVHPTNPVDNLSLEDLQDIYLGEITNWEEVGGDDEDILPVIREVTSGTRGAFDKIVLDDEEPTGDAMVEVTASEVEARVAATENAIGYIGFGHIEEEIKVLSIDGVEPSPEAALSGAYSLQRPLQLLTGPLSRNLAQTFVDFALSDDGQDMVQQEGWVPARSAQ
jgi:phosphate transport system substrate-binding protein